MEIFLLGGALRDLIYFGKLNQDLDFVVVGASIQQMQQAYKQVNQRFPVFQDSLGRDYAMARREQATGRGHQDFKVIIDGVSLEEDLWRRDFTINSIACRQQDIELVVKQLEVLTREQRFNQALLFKQQGIIIDPHGGIEDLLQGILATHNPYFIDDPLRVIRAYRFAAKYKLTISPILLQQLEQMTANLGNLTRGYASDEYRKVVQANCLLDFLRIIPSPIKKYFAPLLDELWQFYGVQFWNCFINLSSQDFNLLLAYLYHKFQLIRQSQLILQLKLTKNNQASDQVQQQLRLSQQPAVLWIGYKKQLQQLDISENLLVELAIISRFPSDDFKLIKQQCYANLLTMINLLDKLGYFVSNSTLTPKKQLSSSDSCRLIVEIYRAMVVYRTNNRKVLHKYHYRLKKIEHWLGALNSAKIKHWSGLSAEQQNLLLTLPQQQRSRKINYWRLLHYLPQWQALLDNS